MGPWLNATDDATLGGPLHIVDIASMGPWLNATDDHNRL